VELDGAAEGVAQLVGFQLTEGGLTMAFEKFRNGDTGGFLDTFVKVDKAPAELAGETSADGAFASTHETGKSDDRGSR
jgi:hypothetical protein